MDAAQNLPEYAGRARSESNAGSLPGGANPRRNPYIGPTAFREGDRLYGRDRELSQLTNLLVAERIVLLHSPSGAGKTSLIQAALIPRLTTLRFRVLPIARVNLNLGSGNGPGGAANRYALSTLLSLDQELPEEEQTPPEGLARMRIGDYLEARQKPDGKSEVEVLIFDQFEEILSLDPTDPEEKHTFFRQLGEALEETRRWALFAMRDDYVGALLPYERWIPSQLHTRFRLDLLGHEAARQAIQRPALESGVVIEDDAIEQLVADLRRVRVQRADGTLEAQLGPHVEPVQLQVVCRRLWETPRPNPQRITVQELAAIGEVNPSLVDDSLVTYYAEQVRSAAAQTGTSERRVREWFDRKLITEQGVRAPVLMEAGTSGGLDNRAVRMLEDAYLVRAEKRRGITWFELAHDRLIAPVRRDNSDWFEANLSPIQRQADLWNQTGRPETLLISGPRLEEARHWTLNSGAEVLPVERDFIEASARQEIRQRMLRQRNQVISVLAVVAALLAVLSWLNYRQAVFQRGVAEDQAAAALANQYAAQSQTELREFPLRSLLLAVEAVHATASRELPRQPAAEEALRAALAEPHGQRLAGTEGTVLSAAFSPDGRWLAAGGADGTVLLWRAETGLQAAEPRRLAGHSGSITGLVFLPDGQRLATGSSDQTARLWDLNAADPAAAPVILRGPDAEITSLAASPDGKWLAAGSLDQNVWLWNISAATANAAALPTDGLSLAAAFSPDGRWLATGDGQNVLLCSVEAGGAARPCAKLTGHTGLVTRLAFSPDGRHLASGSRDHTARLWSLEASGTGASVAALEGHEDWINALEFSPDGALLATGSGDRTVRVWNMRAADPNEGPLVLRGHTELVNAMAFSPDGSRLASAGADRTARLWDLRAADPSGDPMVLRGHDDEILALAFSPDGDLLVTGGKDRTARLWAARGADASASPVVLRAYGEPINIAAYSPDGRWLAAGSGDPALGKQENAVKLWRLGTDPVGEPIFLGGYEGWISALAFDPRGRWLASGGGDDTVRLWDLQSTDPGAEPVSLNGGAGWIWSLAFSPDGRWLASGHEDGSARLWDMEAPGETPLELPGQEGQRVNALAFSPDGRWLAAASGNEGRLWDLKSGSTTRPVVLSAHTDIVSVLAFDPQERWIATGSRDKSVRLWDLGAEDPAARPVVLEGHSDWVQALAFSPDGRWLATGGGDRITLLFDTEELGPFPEPLVLTGHDGAVRALAFSQDGKQLATGGEDGAIRLRHIDGSAPLDSAAALRGHEKAVTTLVFSPDGAWLASGSADQTARLWTTRLETLIEAACSVAGRGFNGAEQRQFFQGKTYPGRCVETGSGP